MHTSKRAMTLIEILLAVAIIAILASILTVSAKHLRNEANARLTESALRVITLALQQYYDFHGKYPPMITEADKSQANWQFNALAAAVNRAGDTRLRLMKDNATANSSLLANDQIPSLAAYQYLHGTPPSRQIISRMSESLLASDGLYLEIPQQARWSLLSFVDPWGTPLRYKYEPGDSFPIVLSAGPDRQWDTSDDIDNIDAPASGI